MEMPAAAIAGMAGVQSAIVTDIEPGRFKHRQPLANLFMQCHRNLSAQSISMSGSTGKAGKVLRNGLTVTLA